MITVPTGEFIGILSDTIPFACPADDVPDLCCVLLEWDADSELLQATATDRVQIGQASWNPDDDPPDPESQDDLFTDWGGADDSWRILLHLDDAKDLVKVFKLAAKMGRVPITLDVDQTQLTVKRSRDTGHSDLTVVIRGSDAQFPDAVSGILHEMPVGKVDQIHYDAKRFAAFGKVRQRGPMRLMFGGETKPTQILIGERFVGAIQPVRVGKEGE